MAGWQGVRISGCWSIRNPSDTGTAAGCVGFTLVRKALARRHIALGFFVREDPGIRPKKLALGRVSWNYLTKPDN